MKTKHKRNKRARRLLILACGLTTQAYSINVDTELMLLVDVSGSVDSSEYNIMMGGYEEAFRKQSVLQAIQGGQQGSIAASVVFWSGSADQSVGVDWMLIDSAASATAFADAISNTTRPFSGMTAIGSGIDYGTTLFGTETGGLDNGYTSNAQIIDISGDGEDNNTPPDNGNRAANVRTSRDASLAAGVDMINGLPIGNAGGALNQYYIDNIIGGESGGVAAFTQTATTFSDVETSLSNKLQSEITAGALKSVAVPEPSSAILLSGALFLNMLRRRR